MSSRITDYDELRCIVCGQRFYSWGELAPHERHCADDADEHADRQRRARIDDKLTGDLP